LEWTIQTSFLGTKTSYGASDKGANTRSNVWSKGVKRMKKIFCVLFIPLVIMLALGGCKDTVAPDDGGTLPPTSSPSATPSPPRTFEYEESTLGKLHIARATDKLLNKYESFHEYIHNKDGDTLLIRTDTVIRDFAFISVKYDDTGDKVSLLAGDTLFSVDELTPEKPFVVKMLDPGGVLPAYGISFVDDNGVKRHYSINLDKRGTEEAPPYFLDEFINGNSQ